VDLHYIDARYPNGVGGPPERFYDRAIAEEAMAALGKLRAFAEAGGE